MGILCNILVGLLFMLRTGLTRLRFALERIDVERDGVERDGFEPIEPPINCFCRVLARLGVGVYPKIRVKAEGEIACLVGIIL